ncbi:MAG: redox-regulated ATPase YchF [Fidelibacterota bacterium]
MPLESGIVGLPNVGKSTLFSALTHMKVPTAAYPFTTVEPNVGMVPVPDPRLTGISAILKPEKVIPTSLRVVDIAGLIKGSHRGEGLGNQFLAQIREVDAVIHVVRCFTNDQVSHISDTLDPVRDIGIVETEIILKDLETVTQRMERISRKVRLGDKMAVREKEFLERLTRKLNDGIPARKLEFQEDEAATLGKLFLISRKPVLYVGNENEEDATSHHPKRETRALLRWAEEEGESVLILSATLEQELAFLDTEDERKFFMEEWGLGSTGLERLVQEAYTLLNLVTFFTTESNYAQAWTVKRETPAVQAAGVIHSDFERGFIKVEVYRSEDLFAHGSVSALRELGLIHTHGRDYIIQDGDVVKFHFRAT